MSKLADSTADRDELRVWPQHQVALTLLTGRVSDPMSESVRWLDLACGRGQLVTTLTDVVPGEQARSKIDYVGMDLAHEYVSETAKVVEACGLKATATVVGDLVQFPQLIAGEFDLITFTNTAHELSIPALVEVLASAVSRLSPLGSLYVYDLEQVDPPELGSIAWQTEDIDSLMQSIVAAAGGPNYAPAVGRWHHRTRTAWSAQVDRQHLPATLAATSVEIRDAGVAALQERARLRLEACRQALESLTVHGAQTGDEEEAKVPLLREFWSLSRALHLEEVN